MWDPVSYFMQHKWVLKTHLVELREADYQRSSCFTGHCGNSQMLLNTSNV